MTYLSNVANERPMLHISATIILAFRRRCSFAITERARRRVRLADMNGKTAPE